VVGCARRGPAGVLRSAAKRRVVPRQPAARLVGQRLTNSPGTPAAEQTATGWRRSSLRRIVKDKRRTNSYKALHTSHRHCPMNRAIPTCPAAAAYEEGECKILAPMTLD
jgi:hypothetical protein